MLTLDLQRYIMADMALTLANLDLYHDENAHLLICVRDGCKFALSAEGSRVTTHLRDKHNVSSEARKGLSRLLKSFAPQGILNPEKAEPRPDGSPEHDKLRVYDGFLCRYCPFRTISPQLIRRHLAISTFGGSDTYTCPNISEVCSFRGRDIDKNMEYVFLQSWTVGSNRKYWVIERDGDIIRPPSGQDIHDHMAAVRDRQKEFLGHEVHGEQPPRETAQPDLSLHDRRPWIERTGWDRTYRDKNHRLFLRILTQVPAALPSGNPRSLVLAKPGVCGVAQELVSPCADETRIAAIIGLVDQMMDRCEETAQTSSRNVRCWLRSSRPLSTYPKPFMLVSHLATTKRYRYLLKRCLAMLFRIYRLSPSDRASIAGVSLSRRQLRFLEPIWNHPLWASPHATVLENLGHPGHGTSGLMPNNMEDAMADDDDNDDNDDDNESELSEDDEISEKSEQDEVTESKRDEVNGDREAEEDGRSSSSEPEDQSVVPSTSKGAEELVDLLFGLTLALGTQRTVDGRPETTILIFFSGILGFSPSLDTFLPARNYTPHLSALIYVLRLVFLEYALPSKSHPYINLERRPRTHQLERLEPIRRKYMVLGSDSPLEELLSLRSFGRVIARTDTPSYLLRWSDNGHIVSLDDKLSVSMGQFRRLPEHFIREADLICKDMMFGWEPAIDLSNIKDDMTNNEKDFSFIRQPDNHLALAYVELSDRACKARRDGLFRNGRWDWQAVFRYRKKDDTLRSLLLGAMDCTGGQKPRCTELLGLYCVNGEHHPRGIFIYNGCVIYVVRHHKAKRTTNREFVVARFLPAALGHILFKYLVYIRPFLDMLYRESQLVTKSPDPCSPLLFRIDTNGSSRPWPTGRLTAIIKQATSTLWGTPANSQQFRQLCIGITEKHVREVYEPLNRFDDTSANARRNVVFAWQSGHRPLQRGTTYGLDGAFPTTLQPQLLELYQWASFKWHEFLHLQSRAVHKPTKPEHLTRLRNSLCTESQSTAVPSSSHDIRWSPISTVKRRRLNSPRRQLYVESSYPPSTPGTTVSRIIDLTGQHDDKDGNSSGDSFDNASPTSGRLHVISHNGTAVERSSAEHNSLGGIFRHASHRFSEVALEDCRLAIDYWREYIKSRSGATRARRRLARVFESIEWWRTIGCPMCFLSRGLWYTDHKLESCDRDGSDRARDIVRWLECLDIPRSITFKGSCSLCEHTNTPCTEIRICYAMLIAETPREKAALQEEYEKKSGRDGHCEYKPLVRRVIASLCTYDGGALGDLLSKIASDEDGVDISSERDARAWFEMSLPFKGEYKDTFVSRLFIVFEALSISYYFRQNYYAGLPPLYGFPDSPPGL